MEKLRKVREKMILIYFNVILSFVLSELLSVSEVVGIKNEQERITSFKLGSHLTRLPFYKESMAAVWRTNHTTERWIKKL